MPGSIGPGPGYGLTIPGFPGSVGLGRTGRSTRPGPGFGLTVPGFPGSVGLGRTGRSTRPGPGFGLTVPGSPGFSGRTGRAGLTIPGLAGPGFPGRGLSNPGFISPGFTVTGGLLIVGIAGFRFVGRIGFSIFLEVPLFCTGFGFTRLISGDFGAGFNALFALPEFEVLGIGVLLDFGELEMVLWPTLRLVFGATVFLLTVRRRELLEEMFRFEETPLFEIFLRELFRL